MVPSSQIGHFTPVSLGFSKAEDSKRIIISEQKNELYVYVEEGYEDPLIEPLVKRVKEETEAGVIQL